jgi:hypothetical protein
MAKDNKKEAIAQQEEGSIKQSQPQPEEVLKKGSKDDFDFRYQTPPPSPPPVEEVKPSRMSRFFSYITTKVQSVMNTNKGKILFGTAFSRTITILFAASVLSGVFPPAIPFAITAAAMSLTAVAVSAIVDTAKTRSLRKLAEESDLLVKNRNALSLQEQMLKINPELSDILKNQLHNRQAPQQQNPQQDNKAGVGAEKKLNIGQMISDIVPSVANFALQTMVATSTGDPLKICNSVRTGVTTAAALITGGVNAKYMVDVAKGLKMYIQEERPYAGEYNTIKELRRNVKKQEIQTLAIQELLLQKNYFELTPTQKQEKFTELTAELKKQVKHTLKEKQARSDEYTARFKEDVQSTELTPAEKQAKRKELIIERIAEPPQPDSILSDARRTLDPFYVRPTGRAPDSPLTKALASEKAKESAKSIVTPEVKDHIVSQELAAYTISQESSKTLDAALSKVSDDLSKNKKEASNKAKSQTSPPAKHNRKVREAPF